MTKTFFARHRLTIGSLLGVVGVILLLVAALSLFSDLRFTIPGILLVIAGAIIAGRRGLREFIANLLP